MSKEYLKKALGVLEEAAAGTAVMDSQTAKILERYIHEVEDEYELTATCLRAEVKSLNIKLARANRALEAAKAGRTNEENNS